MSFATLHQVTFQKTTDTKAKTALKQEPYNLSDLKHDLQCGFVELGATHSTIASLSPAGLLAPQLYHHSTL